MLKNGLFPYCLPLRLAGGTGRAAGSDAVSAVGAPIEGGVDLP
jgi:hypothetical protein